MDHVQHIAIIPNEEIAAAITSHRLKKHVMALYWPNSVELLLNHRFVMLMTDGTIGSRFKCAREQKAATKSFT